MCIFCFITCKCIGQIYYIRGNHFVLLEHLVAIYVSPRGVVITLVYHVWDKAVIYGTFTNEQDFLPKLIRQKYKCQTRIYSCCMPL